MKPTLGRAIAIGCAVTSLTVAILIGNLAVASHMPFAADVSQFRNLAHFENSPQHRWRAVHILAAGCRCSRGVAEHLGARPPLAGIHESVILIGADALITHAISKANLPLNVITAEEATDRYHLQGAPWLVIIAPDDSIRYAGGYTTDRNARNGYLDASIWNAISAGKSFRSLPAFGCAVSQHLKRSIDPLGLKYSLGLGNS